MALAPTLIDISLKVLLTKLELEQSGRIVTLILVSANIGCPVFGSFYDIVALRTYFWTVPMSAVSVNKNVKVSELGSKLDAGPTRLPSEYCVLVQVTLYWQSLTYAGVNIP